MASLSEIVRFFRALPGLTADNTVGAGAVIGCHDRWVFEVQPDGPRWAVAAGVWREGRRVVIGWRFDTVADLERAREALSRVAQVESSRLSVHRLERGKRYRVLKPLTDHYQNSTQVGEELTFVELNFLPYDGGYTVAFEERSLYFQESEDAAILADFDGWFARA